MSGDGMAKPIALDLSSEGRQRLLGGPPHTKTLRAGMVTLKPGESVGVHSTHDYEELVVVLAGRGEMVSEGGGITPISPDRFCYCPPHTVHDVRNTGRVPLRYIYVIAFTG